MRVGEGFAVAMDEEDAVLVTSTDQDRQAKKIGEVPLDPKEAHESDQHRQPQRQYADGGEGVRDPSHVNPDQDEDQPQRVKGGADEGGANRRGGMRNVMGDAGERERPRDGGEARFNLGDEAIESGGLPEIVSRVDVEGVD